MLLFPLFCFLVFQLRSLPLVTVTASQDDDNDNSYDSELHRLQQEQPPYHPSITDDMTSYPIYQVAAATPNVPPSCYGLAEPSMTVPLSLASPGVVPGYQPLSSGWATALTAATSSGVVCMIKRKANAGQGSGGGGQNAPRSNARSLYCLATDNPVRKLSIEIVEWKYPF